MIQHYVMLLVEMEWKKGAETKPSRICVLVILGWLSC